MALAPALILGWLAAGPATADEPPPEARIVVKLSSPTRHSIDEVTDHYPVQVVGALLSSRGIYFVTPTDPRTARDMHKVEELAHKIEGSSEIAYAETDEPTALSDRRYHGWPEGQPGDPASDARLWRDQPLGDQLDLPAAHRLSTGSGTVVAVLDTGVDPTHPALAGRLRPGYDYIDDDSDPSEDG